MQSVSICTDKAGHFSQWKLLDELVIARLDIDELYIESVGLGDCQEGNSSWVAIVGVQ